MAAPLYLFWAIWRERNRIVFDNVDFSLSILKSSFIACLYIGGARGVFCSCENSLVYSLGLSFFGW